MRLVSALLFAALTGSAAHAQEAPPPASEPARVETTVAPAEETPRPAPARTDASRSKVPLRVVRMLPETHQVLLLDKNRGTHVVAEAGQEIDGFIVDEISGDEVTLVAPNGAEVILAAPDMTWRRRAAERRAAATKAATGAPAVVIAPGDGVAGGAPVVAAGEPGPVDPYAEPAASTATSPAGEVRVASASGTPAGATASPGNGTPASGASSATVPGDPYAAYDAGIAAFAEAVSEQPLPPDATTASKPTTTSTKAPAKPAHDDVAGDLAAAMTGAPATATASGAATASAGATITVSRLDVDAALSDFGATAVTFDATFVPNGLRIDSIVDGTILAKAGLKKGDTILAIDGKPLRSFDDAADLYARMQTARAATIQVQRAGKPVTVQVAIR